jgi:hypothetical protein
MDGWRIVVTDSIIFIYMIYDYFCYCKNLNELFISLYISVSQII